MRPVDRLDVLRRWIADRILPWASAHAHVWPSQHAVHGSLQQEVADLHQQLEGAEATLRTIAALPDTTAGSPTTLDEAREIAARALPDSGGR